MMMMFRSLLCGLAALLAVALIGACCDFRAACESIEDGTPIDDGTDEMCGFTQSGSGYGVGEWVFKSGEEERCVCKVKDGKLYSCDWDEI
jgi:hypothetical protein